MSASSAQRVIREDHAALAAMLLSVGTLVDSGPGDDRSDFFETVAAMLFYVDEFPEQRHHPTESNVLFPMLLKAAPELHGAIQRLEMDHVAGEGRVRKLQHLLHAWQFLGDSRRASFSDALGEYVRFYLNHMQVEERELLPIAAHKLTPAQAAELDIAFELIRDPLSGGMADPVYDALFRRITEHAHNPIGFGVA